MNIKLTLTLESQAIVKSPNDAIRVANTIFCFN